MYDEKSPQGDATARTSLSKEVEAFTELCELWMEYKALREETRRLIDKFLALKSSLRR